MHTSDKMQLSKSDFEILGHNRRSVLKLTFPGSWDWDSSSSVSSSMSNSSSPSHLTFLWTAWGAWEEDWLEASSSSWRSGIGGVLFLFAILNGSTAWGDWENAKNLLLAFSPHGYTISLGLKSYNDLNDEWTTTKGSSVKVYRKCSPRNCRRKEYSNWRMSACGNAVHGEWKEYKCWESRCGHEMGSVVRESWRENYKTSTTPKTKTYHWIELGRFVTNWNPQHSCQQGPLQ